MPDKAAAISAWSGGTTTTSSSTPDPATPSTARRTTGWPPRSRSSLRPPIRRESPAASTTPAITRSPSTVAARKEKAPRTGCSAGPVRARPELLLGRDGRLDRALGEDFEEMLLVFDRALEIGLDVHAVGCLVRCRRDARRVQRLAGERGLHALGAHRVGSRPRDADRGLGALAAVDGEHRRHADHREAA